MVNYQSSSHRPIAQSPKLPPGNFAKALEMSTPFRPYGTPPPLDLDEYKDSFELWESQWETFIFLSNIDTGLESSLRLQYKANILKSCLSKNTLAAVLSSGLSKEQLEDPEKIMGMLRNRCNAGKNRHIRRMEFSQRVQRPNELVDDWLCDLRDSARKCEFSADCCADCEPSRILGQIIHGVNQEELRSKLLEMSEIITLESAISLLRTVEAASTQSSDLKLREARSVQVTRRLSYRKVKEELEKLKKSENTEPASETCKSCGKNSHRANEDCPADGKTCYNCRRIGHFKSVCPSQRKQNLAAMIESVHIDAVHSRSATAYNNNNKNNNNNNNSNNNNNNNNKELVELEVKFGDKGARKNIRFLPDVDAEIDAIPYVIFDKQLRGADLRHAVTPQSANGVPILSEGKFAATLTLRNRNLQGRTVCTELYVLYGLPQPVLSKRTQMSLGMLKKNYPQTDVSYAARRTRTVRNALSVSSILNSVDGKNQAEASKNNTSSTNGCGVIDPTRRCLSMIDISSLIASKRMNVSPIDISKFDALKQWSWLNTNVLPTLQSSSERKGYHYLPQTIPCGSGRSPERSPERTGNKINNNN